MSKTKKIIFVIILVILLSITIIILINNKFKNISTTDSDTGHFYGKPRSAEEISYIEIVYNNGKDYVSINKENIINYYTYDKDGNTIYNKVDTDTSEIINYIYENDLKYLKNYKHMENEKWALEIYSPGASCLISGKNSPPKWFNKLLEKLNVEENGYLLK